MKLVELDRLKVIYTCNAKEVLTPEQLKLEVQDEVSQPPCHCCPLLSYTTSHELSSAFVILKNVSVCAFLCGVL